MADVLEYHQKIAAALAEYRQWLEKSELPKLKDELRTFHVAFYSLFSLFLKRRIINEDPYKQDVKIADIAVPDTSPFPETERVAKLSIRLAQFDNQLDFLVNFYQISLDSLSIEKVRRILGLIKYIDWVHFTIDAKTSANTKAMVATVAQARQGADSLAANIINQALTSLSRASGAIAGHLKEVVGYNRENYKMELRNKVTRIMPPGEAAQIAAVKRKFSAVMPGKLFYPDLVEELIREDYSKDGENLRAQALQKLTIPNNKVQTAKPSVSFKTVLIEGLVAIGGAGSSLAEIAPKVAENVELLENQRKSLGEKIRLLLQRMLNKEPAPVIYTVEYVDPARGVKVKETVNFNVLKFTIHQKITALQAVSNQGTGASKLAGMEDARLLGLLERHIRDVQSLHKTLSGLDDFFKSTVSTEDRSKVKGIKPELGVIKNAIVNANRKRYEYSTQKEEEDQFKRLGISSDI
ncbi:MAG: hypothetical protein LBH70_01845 [Spirochaetaceae bacterium]|jgi:hypothetical protein|nr:hypothetical protein [Spirochaetaceae bacterium]